MTSCRNYTLIILIIVFGISSAQVAKGAESARDTWCKSTGKLAWELYSPDKNIKANVTLNDNGQPVYTIDLLTDGKWMPIILPSSLGLERNDESFVKGLSLTGIDHKIIRDEYTLVAGKRMHNVVRGNDFTLSLTNQNGAPIDIGFRLFNDGVAFRYQFPDHSSKVHTIKTERSAFDIPLTGTAWMLPYDTVGVWSPAYEAVYEKEIAVGTPAPSTTGWAFPSLFHVNNNWLLITEAGLDSTYCGTHLAAKSPNGSYTIEYPLETEGYGHAGGRYPSSSLPWSTPWRVMIMGNDPGAIIQSNMVYNLSAPNQVKDTSWIHPGKSSWSWWGDHSSAHSYQKLKEYVNLSHRMGWKYSLVDAEWDFMQGGTLAQLAQYAKSQNVELFVWYNSGGPHNKAKAMYVISDSLLTVLAADLKLNAKEQAGLQRLTDQSWFDDVPYFSDIERVTGKKLTDAEKDVILTRTYIPNATPRDKMYERKARRQEFAKLRDMGVRGVKIDFFNSDKQDVIRLYLDIARDAADYGILVNTHGCTLPRGWQRTWPNYISMEGVRGAELYGTPTYPPRAVWLNCLYPYTRNVVGPMDYTPVIFDDYSPEIAHITTFGHELALSVIFECGIQHFADRKESYLAQPQYVIDYLRKVPVTWDDTRYISGYPARDLVLARRHGDSWYVAGINGEMREKTFRFTLPFLPDGQYTLTIITDDAQPRKWQQYSIKIDNRSEVSIPVLPAGGFTATIQ